MKNEDQVQLVEDCLLAYQEQDKAAAEKLIHPDFTFISPQDDRIDRAAYFKRCWPFSELKPTYQFIETTESKNGLLLLYNCITKDGKQFRNVELFTFKDGQILSVEVFFGNPKFNV